MSSRTLRLAAVLAACLLAGGCADPAGPSPEQQALFAQAVDAELVVPAVRNTMQYAVTRLEAPAGATVRLVMDNTATTSPAMIHNVVVVRSEGDVRRVGQSAGALKPEMPVDEAVLAFTPLAGPGERAAVVFTMPPPGEYPYLCSYPGHFQYMQGTLVSTE